MLSILNCSLKFLFNAVINYYNFRLISTYYVPPASYWLNAPSTLQVLIYKYWNVFAKYHKTNNNNNNKKNNNNF